MLISEPVQLKVTTAKTCTFRIPKAACSLCTLSASVFYTGHTHLCSIRNKCKVYHTGRSACMCTSYIYIKVRKMPIMTSALWCKECYFIIKWHMICTVLHCSSLACAAVKSSMCFCICKSQAASCVCNI